MQYSGADPRPRFTTSIIWELTQIMAVQLFKRTKQLELKVDEILDLVSQSAMAFEQAIDSYMSEGVGAPVLLR